MTVEFSMGESTELNEKNNKQLNSNCSEILWLLIQENSCTKNYAIIHTSDLVDQIINNEIKYCRDGNIVQGRIVLASKNRDFIEQKLIELNRNILSPMYLSPMSSTSQTSSESSSISNHIKDSWFLVQYSKEPNKIVHAIINKKDIDWSTHSSYCHREIYINESDNKILATVLYVSNKEEDLLNEMKILKLNFFNEIFRFPTNDPEPKPWLLVQYSCGINNITYAVINENDTVWKKENMYKDVVAYLCDGQVMNQAVILKRSMHQDDMEIELQNIKESSLLSIFPLENNVVSCINYSLGNHKMIEGLGQIDLEYLQFNQPTQNRFNTIDINERRALEIQHNNTPQTNSCRLSFEKDSQLEAEILNRLQLMEFQMQNENMIIANSLKSLEQIRNAMNQRLATLEDCLQRFDSSSP